MDADALMLARVQFAFTISAHIIFPSVSIGLASYLAVLQGLWLWRREPVYLTLFDYWKTIFALVFGMGVVSGVVMSYQIGANWSVFSDRAGPVLGPLLGYEVLSAFFLESGFLGVMLFGRERVGERLHFASTALVALGTLMSAFWILSANSWMQTPAGHVVAADGRFLPEDWWKIVFNPSFPYRFAHMVLACYLTTAFVVGATGAWHLLRGGGQAARTMFSMAMWMAAIVAPAQLVVGDLHGLNTLQHQPAKIAAMEGHFETQRRAPFIIFGLPDPDAETTRYALQIPGAGSLVLGHSLDAEILGLKHWPKDERPDPRIPFFAFRIMLAIGMLMIAVGLWSLLARWRGRLHEARWLHRATLAMGPSGFAALLAGWFVTETGRQPWIVYGLMRTAEAASPIGAGPLSASLTAFVLVYLLVFGAGTLYALALMATPPEGGLPEPREATRRAAHARGAEAVP
ncbi:MAG: cytochrome ubiquinol oxidase subunit I [Methylobacteriaceae bacterium]|nr:cytochrome ubiquinol oxidase subunit I [Methylobacteriaceae bacterium]